MKFIIKQIVINILILQVLFTQIVSQESETEEIFSSSQDEENYSEELDDESDQNLKIELKEFKQAEELNNVNEGDIDYGENGEMDEDNIFAERLEIMEQWEQLMVDFNPDDMLTFVLEKGEKEIFFETINKATSLRGAYFVSFSEKNSINFEIRDVRGKKILFENNKKREGIFSIDVTEWGDYQFIFHSPNSSVTISFALDVTHSTQKHLKHHDIKNMDSLIEDFNQEIRDIMRESKFSQKRSQSHLKYLQETHSKMLLLNVIEIILIFGATVWQIYYIKKILDNKSIV